MNSINNNNNVSISATHVLSDADFVKIRALQQQQGSHLSLRGKRKDRALQSNKKQQLIHGISDDLSAHDL